MDVIADHVAALQLPLGDVFDEVVHVLGVLVEGHEGVGDLHQVVALLKDAGRHERGHVLLVAVDLLDLGLAGLPLGLGIVQHIGGMDLVAPLLDVLADDKAGLVHGEGAGLALGPRDGDAPVVDLVELAGLGVVAMAVLRMEDHGKRLVLLDQSLGVSVRLDGLKEVLLCGEHAYSFW